MRQRIVDLICETASPELAAQARPLAQTHGNIVAELISVGFTAAAVVEASATVTGIPAAPMKWLRNPQITGNLDPILCRQVQAAPVAVADGKMCIAYADPEMAVQAAELGFPAHQAYLCAPAPLQMALSLLETSDTAPLPESSPLDGATAPLPVVRPPVAQSPVAQPPVAQPAVVQAVASVGGARHSDLEAATSALPFAHNNNDDGPVMLEDSTSSLVFVEPGASQRDDALPDEDHPEGPVVPLPRATAPPSSSSSLTSSSSSSSSSSSTRPSVATVAGSTVPQLPGGTRPAGFVPVVAVAPPSSRVEVSSPTVRPPVIAPAMVAPTMPSRPMIEDVTGDIAFGIAPRPEVTNSGVRPKVEVTGVRAKVEVTNSGVRPKVEVTNSGSNSGPRPKPEPTPARETSAPKESPLPREAAREATKEAPKASLAETSLPKMNSRRGGLNIEKAADVKPPEPKPLPMPPRAATSSEPAALPTSGGTPRAQKWEPLDPVIEPVKGKPKDKPERSDKTEKAERPSKSERGESSDGLLAVSNLVAAEGGGSVGGGRVPMAAAVVVILAALVVVAVIMLKPGGGAPAASSDEVIAKQVALVTQGRAASDPVAAIALFDEAVNLDTRTTGARDALLARAQLAMKLGLVDLARDDVARLRRRSDVEPIASELDRVLATPPSAAPAPDAPKPDAVPPDPPPASPPAPPTGKVPARPRAPQ